MGRISWLAFGWVGWFWGGGLFAWLVGWPPTMNSRQSQQNRAMLLDGWVAVSKTQTTVVLVVVVPWRCLDVNWGLSIMGRLRFVVGKITLDVPAESKIEETKGAAACFLATKAKKINHCQDLPCAWL